ncbi:MAG: metallophosphoesterase [Archangium sp.]|nr:metallophosphoesterase [Archangium sp.]
MRRLAHLSDLHYGADPETQPRLYEGLLEVFVGRENIDALLFTGDVFDSNEPRPGMVEGFLRLHAGIEAKLGAPKPTIILPGNHDRRAEGVFAPYREELFDDLRRAFASRPDVQVMGGQTPFLAQRVKLADFPADVVAYDSTWLPEGIASAGGIIRQEDLIQVGSELAHAADVDRPLLFLLHHHLIPTPVTDTSVIDTKGRPPIQKFLVGKVLPWLVSNGDREELTMTALGAGSALTTLQTLGRAVFVLHGHKHYATARLLKGIDDDDSDLLITSAGSCGLPQDWIDGDYEEAPKLWPSVNFIELDAKHVKVTSQAWSPWDPHRRSSLRRIVHAAREGRRWNLVESNGAGADFDEVLTLNDAKVKLSLCSALLGRVDVSTTRHLESHARAVLEDYWEVITGPEGARMLDALVDGKPRKDQKCPAKVKVARDGTTSYRVEGGAFLTVTDADGRAFDSVELLNRSRSKLARLVVDLGPVKTQPFASVTNLTTGRERPYPFTREGGTVTITYENCPARTMLRLYWPLAR